MSRQQIGFSATQKGMTTTQFVMLSGFLLEALQKGPVTLHHGDCVGGDAEAHGLVLGLQAEGQDILTHLHPADVPGKRAFCAGDFTEDPMPPLLRNLDIVQAVSVLVAAPDGDKERLRSGTWTTVRYARLAEIETLVLPRGT